MGRKTNAKGANVPSKSKEQNFKYVASSTSGESSEGEFDGKFSKRKLNSNWQQYGDLPTDSEDQRGLDFAQFVDQKPSTDSHFSFSSEKNWELQDKVSDYFRLNIKDLQNEILCVPLHERLKLDSKLLNHDQVAAFEKSATINQNNVKEYAPLTQEISNKVLSVLKDTLKKIELPNSDNKVVEDNQTWNSAAISQQSECVKHSTWDESSENFFSLQTVDQELDEILSLPTTKHDYSEATAKPASDNKSTYPESTEVLNEDWLDSLLNED